MANSVNLDDLEIMLDVLRYTRDHKKGAVRHVAAERSLQGSVISNTITRVQERLSCRLVVLDRNAVGRLTPEGLRFLDEAPVLLNEFRTFLESFVPEDRP